MDRSGAYVGRIWSAVASGRKGPEMGVRTRIGKRLATGFLLSPAVVAAI